MVLFFCIIHYHIYMKFQSLRHRLFHQRRFRQMLLGSMILSLAIAFLIVPIEQNSPHASIHTFGDGLWWVVQTATTVGYGDVVPVTEWGRFLGIFLQILGTVMFGALIGMISSGMGRSHDEMYWSRAVERLDELTTKLEKIEMETQYIIKSQMPVIKETKTSTRTSESSKTKSSKS